MATAKEPFNLEALLKSISDKIDANSEEIRSTRAELIAEQRESVALLNAKIDSTNKMVDSINEKVDATNEKVDATNAKLESTRAELTIKIESAVQQATQEYTLKMDEKFKEYRREAQREMKENFKRLSDSWNERFHTVKQEQDQRIQNIQDTVEVTVTKTNILEEKTAILETTVKKNEKVLSENSTHMSTLREDVFGEVNKLQLEVRRRPNTMWMYPPHSEDRPRLVFKGNKLDNPIEFLRACEREMERIGIPLSETEKIEFVSQHFKDSAARWFTIVRDNITTFAQFRTAFENRYWNVHTQRQIRDKLEFGRFPVGKNITMEEYTIQLVEQSKHLQPPFSENELVLKLAYHFSREIRLAAYTQGIKTIEELLVLISQSASISVSNFTPRYTPREGDKYQQEVQNRPWWKRDWPESKKENKAEGKPNYNSLNSQKRKYEGDFHKDKTKNIRAINLDKQQTTEEQQPKEKLPKKNAKTVVKEVPYFDSQPSTSRHQQ